MSSAANSSSASSLEGNYCFIAEWFDAQASIVRKYHLFYFLQDHTLELFDVKNKRTFLKRCSYPSVSVNDLYIGAQITIYARQLKIVNYGDETTRAKLEVAQGRTLALIKPNGLSSIGAILDVIYAGNLKLGRMKLLQLTVTQAQTFYGDNARTQRVQDLSAGPVVGMELIGSNVHKHLVALQSVTKNDYGRGIHADNAMTDVHIASSERNAQVEIDFLFNNPNIASPATFTNATVGVIKPHAIQAGQAGRIIDIIQKSGFEIRGLELFNLDRQSCEEFLEVYKGVVPEYNSLVEQLGSGSCIALELHDIRGGDNANIVQSFRDLCGPSDPQIAKHIRPHSLRAQFGLNKIKNAIHCTDLPEDGGLEAEFFFSILQKK